MWIMQTISHSGTYVSHLLQFVLLLHLAIVTNSTEVAQLHSNRDTSEDTGTLGQFSKPYMLSARCRLGSKVECSRPVHVPDGFRGSDVKHGPDVQSVSNSLSSIISDTQSTTSNPVEQILSQPITLSSSSNHPRPQRKDALDKLQLNQDGEPSVGTSGRQSRQLLRMRQSVSRNNFRSLPIDRRREPPGLRTLVSRKENGSESGKTRELREDSELVPVATDRPNVIVSDLARRWTAPPVESGPLMMVTVAQGKTADFAKIQDAIGSVPPRNTQRVIIRIHAGTYREKVVVPYNKPFITFHGDENGGTILSWNATASSTDYDFGETKDKEKRPYESKFGKMENSSSSLFGTMHSASVTILSDGFVAQHIVFQNSARPPEPGAVGAQAVAFLVAGDRAAFYYCSFLGAQDTLYDYTGRHYYLNCYIEGSIDFIFGNGRSLFEGCHLHSIAKSFGAIAAHQRPSPADDTGFSFDRCSVTGSGTLYLGRAWSPYARIVFARTYFENIISAEGWSDFGDPHRQSTTFFGQYQCTGPGANLSHRAPWAKLLTDNDVLPYLGLNFVNGKQWLATWPVDAQQNATKP